MARGGYAGLVRAAAGAAAALALAGAAPADPLLARLLADARAVQPAGLSFERTQVASETGSSGTERHTRVDRWDGKAWSVISIDGKPPEPKAAAAAIKDASAGGAPGYYRLAPYFIAPATRAAGPAGTVVYRYDRLPPGAVAVKGAPAEKFAAELTVETGGPVPYVRRARYFAPAPFRLMMVARLDRFEAVSEYRLSAAGRPELVRQTVDLSGALFGRDGSRHQDATYVYR